MGQALRMKKAAWTDDLPHLRAGRRIGGGLRRVVQECCEHALQRHRRAPTADAVHEARRALKRARAALRLGEELGAAGARTMRRRLSAIARELSPRRDATIVGEISKRWAAKLCEPGPAAAGKPGRRPAARDASWWERWQRRLTAEMKRVSSVNWGRPADEDVRRALHRSAKRVCKQAKKACAHGDIASAHEWRKAVIVLREQVLVVRPLLTKKEEAACGKLHALAQRLGKATDYYVLKQAVERAGDSSAVERAENARIGQLAKRRRVRALRMARKRWPKVRRILRKRF